MFEPQSVTPGLVIRVRILFHCGNPDEANGSYGNNSTPAVDFVVCSFQLEFAGLRVGVVLVDVPESSRRE